MFEVYVVIVKNSIVYIGSGQANKRRFHASSGVSHVYMLNKITFTDPESMQIIALHSNLSKERSLELEMSLIEEYQPIFNSAGTRSKNCRYTQQFYYEELIKDKKDVSNN